MDKWTYGSLVRSCTMCDEGSTNQSVTAVGGFLITDKVVVNVDVYCEADVNVNFIVQPAPITRTTTTPTANKK